VFSTLFVALSTKDISGLLLLCEAFKKLAPMREVLSVRMEKSSMKPLFDPAKRQRKDSTSAAAHKSTGMRAGRRMMAVRCDVSKRGEEVGVERVVRERCLWNVDGADEQTYHYMYCR